VWCQAACLRKLHIGRHARSKIEFAQMLDNFLVDWIIGACALFHAIVLSGGASRMFTWGIGFVVRLDYCTTCACRGDLHASTRPVTWHVDRSTRLPWHSSTCRNRPLYLLSPPVEEASVETGLLPYFPVSPLLLLFHAED